MNSTPAYRHTEYDSRICLVCSSPMTHFSDGFISLSKCIICGYTHKPSGMLKDQHFYDRPILASGLATYLEKKGYYEMYTPLDESIYNALYTQGWEKTEITYQVINDLQLRGEPLDYFLRKVDQVL